MITLVLAAVAMALKDALGTLLVVAEARGRGMLAGAMDATGDLATILVTLAGAGAVILHGWTLHTILLLSVMTVTSFFGTWFWTRQASRLMPDLPSVSVDQVIALEARLIRLEQPGPQNPASRLAGMLGLKA